jgi:diadenylate cyclase
MITRLVQLYESIGTRDLIQIGILAVVFYAGWRFLKRACGLGASIGRGLSVVAVGLFLLMQLVVASLDLTELSTLLDYLLVVVLVALLVIFQPELRRGLMLLGQSGLWRYFSAPSSPVEDRIAEAAVALARERIGALIAIQRETSLDGYSETGEKLDAEVSSLLLRQLFWPNSPLHDGAVILSNGRVQAAACQLPLHAPADQPTEQAGFVLGMRHRAALSLSEETDAVLVVVSEETGRISLATRGALEIVSPAELAQQLGEILNNSRGPTAQLTLARNA